MENIFLKGSKKFCKSELIKRYHDYNKKSGRMIPATFLKEFYFPFDFMRFGFGLVNEFTSSMRAKPIPTNPIAWISVLELGVMHNLF
jgi:hypothetical protein